MRCHDKCNFVALRASKLGSVIFTKQNSSLVSLPAAQQKPGLRSTDHFVPDPFYSIGFSHARHEAGLSTYGEDKATTKLDISTRN